MAPLCRMLPSVASNQRAACDPEPTFGYRLEMNKYVLFHPKRMIYIKKAD